MKKAMFSLVSALLLVGFMSCGDKPDASKASSSSNAKKEVAKASDKADKKASKGNRKGKLIYKQYCVICHGADGKLAVSDAKDLSVSTISMEERINQITNGKGLMTPYKDILSEEQIQSVAEYLDELKK